ncbi:TonB protein C-terminal [Propionispira arboris]|uniref:TonB protein C-terminal n=1 Tax=Propionispira arboris TaxID=84035 RepID=A0A1H7BHH8_9FIRM|nr:energy transducer TonB [Propionispira arboris]SEJ77193.1 TonB protein C-terminal [Propionispira arboris]
MEKERWKWKKAFGVSLTCHVAIAVLSLLVLPEISVTPLPEEYMELELAAQQDIVPVKQAELNTKNTMISKQNFPAAKASLQATAHAAEAVKADGEQPRQAVVVKGAIGAVESTAVSGDGPESATSSTSSNMGAEVTGVIQKPVVLSMVEPVYPTDLKNRGIEGRVRLRVQIHADGSVGSVEVAGSSGYEAMDAAAVSAMQNWLFIPAKRADGQSVGCYAAMPITFGLK